MNLRITVPGAPVTQSSMKAVARGHRAILTHDKWPAWGRQVPLDGPVAGTLVFWLARLKSHYATGHNVDRLHPSAPALATRPGDHFQP